MLSSKNSVEQSSISDLLQYFTKPLGFTYIAFKTIGIFAAAKESFCGIYALRKNKSAWCKSSLLVYKLAINAVVEEFSD